uniref:Adenylate cyclase 10 n=1 Tax=Rousettus aegyptiacus TaxID=9407 RepID=A0A7J8BBM6_ROUAE|nr:adenylate cyclase 10 [Rousettus aegyptiacus]
MLSRITKAYLELSLHHQLAGDQGVWFKYEIMAMEHIFSLARLPTAACARHTVSVRPLIPAHAQSCRTGRRHHQNGPRHDVRF